MSVKHQKLWWKTHQDHNLIIPKHTHYSFVFVVDCRLSSVPIYHWTTTHRETPLHSTLFRFIRPISAGTEQAQQDTSEGQHWHINPSLPVDDTLFARRFGFCFAQKKQQNNWHWFGCLWRSKEPSLLDLGVWYAIERELRLVFRRRLHWGHKEPDTPLES